LITVIRLPVRSFYRGNERVRMSSRTQNGERVSIPFYYHPDFSGYDFGASHPFRGERFSQFLSEIEKRFPTVFGRLDLCEPELAGDELLGLVHTRAYIERVASLEKRRGYLSVDTQVLPGSVDAARMIVGASVEAARAAVENGIALGFGGLHHAGTNYGEGFCIFNDVAVAARALLGDGLSRICILDTDAHQGNGTMDIFYEDPRVLYVSLHQDPRTLYPGKGFIDEIGAGEGKGYTVNIPMPILSDELLYEKAMTDIVLPLIDAFEPEFIIRNGGSDPLYTDILTNLGLDLEGLSNLTRRIATEAETRKTPLLDLFLSGYGPYVTEGWLAIIRGILNEQMELSIPEEELVFSQELRKSLTEVMGAIINELKSNLSPYWSAFK